MSQNNQNIPFNRDKFLRALHRALRDESLAYKEKKESTSNDSLVLPPKPIMYDFFVDE